MTKKKKKSHGEIPAVAVNITDELTLFTQIF